MRVKPLIRNFIAGEVAPQLDGLIDGPIQGCRTLENFIVRKQGGVERRPGTKYAGEVRDNLLDHADCESTDVPHVRGDAASVVDATFARDNGEAYEGTYSCKLTKTAAAGAGDAYARFVDNLDTDDLHELVPGRTYRLTAQVYIPSAGGPDASQARIQFPYYDSGAWTYNGLAATTQDAWEQLDTGEISIPSTATGIRAEVYIHTNAEQNEYFYVDKIKLQEVAASTRIIPFQSTTGAWYIVEMGQFYARFWKVSTHAVMGGVGSETEVTTPFNTAQLRDVKYVVIKDYIYFTHPSHPVQRLKWTSDTSWTWEKAPLRSSSRIIAGTNEGFLWMQENADLSKAWTRIDALVNDGTRDGDFRGIVWAGDKWLATGTHGIISISYDGELWAVAHTPSAGAYYCMLFIGGMLMAGRGATYGLDISADGLTWHTEATTSVSPFCGAHEPDSDTYVIAGPRGAGHLTGYYSQNHGTSWTATGSLQFSTDEAYGMDYGDPTFVVVGEDGRISTSSTGTAWTSVTSGIATNLNDVKWFPFESVFVTCGDSGVILTSSTGAAWTSVTSGTSENLQALVVDGAQIIAGGTNGALLNSQDGITWQLTTLSAGQDISCLASDYDPDYPEEVFIDAEHYPKSCSYHEGRLFVANTAEDPNKIWASRTNHPDVFKIGPYDDDALEIVLGGRKQSRVLWLEGASHLVVGTDEREGIVIGGDAGITASNRRLLWQSTYGSDATLQGLLINDAVLFAQRNATIVRALRYANQEQPPVDLTFLADHVTSGGILEWDHQKTPESIIWAIRDDGQLLSLSYDPGIGINAWARHPTRSGDEWESVAVTGGSVEDSVWLVAVRDINGSTARYIEYMDVRDFGDKEDAHFVDAGYDSAIAGASFGGLTVLEGETVDVLINGNMVQSKTVSSGSITLDITMPIAHSWYSVCWSPELNLFCAVAEEDEDDAVTTSPDGITWTARTTPGAAWRSVVWSPELNLFCAVAGTEYFGAMTSPDGTTWTARTTVGEDNWRSVCWSAELSLFCAVAIGGDNRVMTSPDGIAWTARTAAETNMWISVCWSAGLNLFCAVSEDGTNRVMTSPDGIAWTARTAAEANTWHTVCWSPRLNLFCAVSEDGTNRVMTSPDGTTWTGRTAAEANGWISVCWSAELALFCAVSEDGTNRVMTSPDGIAWTARVAAEANAWQSVCWSAERNLFCAVAYSGTNRVMISSDGITWGIPVHVGLPYDSKLQTTRLRTGSPWGENVGLKMTIPKVYTWFYETIGGKIGPTETNTNDIPYTATSDLTTDLVEVALPSYHNEDGYLWVIQDDPLPMTLLALSPEVKMGER